MSWRDIRVSVLAPKAEQVKSILKAEFGEVPTAEEHPMERGEVLEGITDLLYSNVKRPMDFGLRAMAIGAMSCKEWFDQPIWSAI